MPENSLCDCQFLEWHQNITYPLIFIDNRKSTDLALGHMDSFLPRFATVNFHRSAATVALETDSGLLWLIYPHVTWHRERAFQILAFKCCKWLIVHKARCGATFEVGGSQCCSVLYTVFVSYRIGSKHDGAGLSSLDPHLRVTRWRSGLRSRTSDFAGSSPTRTAFEY